MYINNNNKANDSEKVNLFYLKSVTVYQFDLFNL